jgi:C1A family cysteine protease
MIKAGGCIFVSDHTNPQHPIVVAKDSLVPTFTRTPQIMALAKASTSSTHIITEHTPISNQGALSSCVANATADAFEILKGLEDSSKVEQLSRLFLYWNARLYSKQTDKDQGTFIMYAMQSLLEFGLCSESTWNYDTSKVFAQPTQLAYKEGDDNTFKLDSFYKIRTMGTYRLQDVETAIRADHPVIFGTNVDGSFEGFNGGDKALDPPSSWLGGHAMVIVGVRYNPDLQFCVRNSWGPSWGNSGHVWLSSAYITWDQTDDLYVGTRMDNLLK